METKERRPEEEAYKQVYLVRIYRRGDDPPGSLVGIVEDVATGKRGSFQGGPELLDRLERFREHGKSPGEQDDGAGSTETIG